MFPIATIAANALESVFSIGSNARANPVTPVTTTAITDTNQLSPFAQIAGKLQQMQQSDPAQYAQVTGQIAANLQSAAQTAQSQGNTARANELNQIAGDFTTASTTGQLPNFQDLAGTIAGYHHHAGGSALSIIQTTIGR